MTTRTCSRESELWTSIADGAWPPALETHVSACESCRDLVRVIEALRVDATATRVEDAPPSAALVWWRAQLRARREARERVERPLTIVHGLAMASAAGLIASAAGLLASRMGWSAPAFAGTLSALTASLTSPRLGDPWSLVAWALLAVTLAVTPVALWVLFAEE